MFHCQHLVNTTLFYSCICVAIFIVVKFSIPLNFIKFMNVMSEICKHIFLYNFCYLRNFLLFESASSLLSFMHETLCQSITSKIIDHFCTMLYTKTKRKLHKNLLPCFYLRQRETAYLHVRLHWKTLKCRRTKWFIWFY